MEPESNDTKITTNPNPLRSWTGTDLLTLGNALNKGAQEIKSNGLSYSIPRKPDLEAFITKTDQFFHLILKAWEAIKLAIREDRDDLNLYGILEDTPNTDDRGHSKEPQSINHDNKTNQDT